MTKEQEDALKELGGCHCQGPLKFVGTGEFFGPSVGQIDLWRCATCGTDFRCRGIVPEAEAQDADT